MSASVQNLPGWLSRALRAEARQRHTSLDGHLQEVGAARLLGGTRTTVRCHFLPRTPQGQVRVAKLAAKLADEIVEYCIPRDRIQEARLSPSTAPTLALARQAQELFTPLLNTGEPGELLLYLLLESVLQLPQLLCKMSLKTNARMHVHGADGVHGAVTPEGDLALYWGEAKLHGEVNKAIDRAFDSLVPFITDDGSGTSRRDLMLLRAGLNLTDPDLVDALARYFNDDAPESNRIEYRGAVLVGFDLDGYPDPHDAERNLVVEVETALARWHDRIADRVAQHEVDSLVIEVFCVPFPSVAELRDAVRAALRLTS